MRGFKEYDAPGFAESTTNSATCAGADPMGCRLSLTNIPKRR
jgi:hypothetical protein